MRYIQFSGWTRTVHLNKKVLLAFVSIHLSGAIQAQTGDSLGSGLIGTIVLMALVIAVILVLFMARLMQILTTIKNKGQKVERQKLMRTLEQLDQEELAYLRSRQEVLERPIEGTELGGNQEIVDNRHVITKAKSEVHYSPMFDKKKSAVSILEIPGSLQRIIIAFLGSATIWLIFGTLVGQYLGLKFVWPDLDHQAWLSFGRLRPVHTNAVFWGWASMAMLGLGHFVVSRTSNAPIYSTRLSWIAWFLINSAVLIGSLSLMNGINNGGGEYREYIWPIAGLFAIGLLICLYNFVKTIASRKTPEIYVSNWYIMGACLWTLILVLIGYLPFYQNGLGETIIQGYYMHQGVGMWFMTFTLGLVYYFLPQALNKPIHSYSLGVLAFWTQMLFYTLIGTHHFIFSPLPWSLQTIAIVFSMGMLIPVIAGTTNFLMTMKGAWSNLKSSYVLPFLLIGVLFYFVGSAQGTMQAFRYSNLVWHFNDFNVAHSHMTMYGIITFMMWGGVYYLLPRITGKRPAELLVGAHFWIALMGLVIYMWSLMIGGTFRGMSWLRQDPFLESVVMMAPYWLWRAIGGTMMFVSHLIFAWNFVQMTFSGKVPTIEERVLTKFSMETA